VGQSTWSNFEVNQRSRSAPSSNVVFYNKKGYHFGNLKNSVMSVKMSVYRVFTDFFNLLTAGSLVRVQLGEPQTVNSKEFAVFLCFSPKFYCFFALVYSVLPLKNLIFLISGVKMSVNFGVKRLNNILQSIIKA